MRISSNYGLKLMEGTDNVKRQDFVDNFSKIDTEMRAIENEAYPIVEATGTNAYIGANVRIQSLKKGTKLTLFVGTNATGNCSLNLNSYGSKNIKDSNGNIVTNIKANIPYNLCYNGTDFILQGKGGGGNLIPKYLLAGYYGEGDNGRVDGAMANNGAVTSTLTAGTSYTIPAGYHNGSGKITANSLASQTSATATAPQILSGQTAFVNGSKITGSMPNLSGNSSILYENGNGTKVIVGDQAFGPITNTDGNNRVLIRYSGTNGYITGNTLVGISTSNMASTLGLTADKIVAGNNICGINGIAKNVTTGTTSPALDGSGNLSTITVTASTRIKYTIMVTNTVVNYINIPVVGEPKNISAWALYQDYLIWAYYDKDTIQNSNTTSYGSPEFICGYTRIGTSASGIYMVRNKLSQASVNPLLPIINDGITYRLPVRFPSTTVKGLVFNYIVTY